MVLCALAGAANATAATVEVAVDANNVGHLIFEAGAGEVNQVTLDVTRACESESDPCEFFADVVDTGALLEAQQGCDATSANSARCWFDWIHWRWTKLEFALGDLADDASVANECNDDGEEPMCEAIIDGGDGNDTLIGTHSAGWDGHTAHAIERLFGGAGDDELLGGSHLDGGTGADTITGGSDFHQVSLAVYDDRVAPVSVALNGLPDDGERDEGDLVSDVGGVIGGAGNDYVVDDFGTVRNEEHFDGGLGNDTIVVYGGYDWVFGGAGKDDLFGGKGRTFLYGEEGADTLRAGDGADIVRGGPGNDWLWGGRQNDYVNGDVGADAITPGPGRDEARGSAGTDTFHARDGSSDVLRGGDGWDRARIDWGRDSTSSLEAFF